MKYLDWDRQKNESLKQERGISFEEIAYLIEKGQILGIEQNPSRPHQKIHVLEVDGYAVIVPYVKSENSIFLKTAFPSRKYATKYGLKEQS